MTMVTCAAVVLQGCPDRVRWPKASKGDPLLKIGCHLKKSIEYSNDFEIHLFYKILFKSLNKNIAGQFGGGKVWQIL